MRSNFTQLYVHCVWATWDRLPLITSENRSNVYSGISQQCQKMRCKVLALGGIEDHVHLLVSLASNVCISDLVKATKGSSSHLMTHEIQPDTFFKWQGSYGAFTVSKEALETVIGYINNQSEHHRSKSIIPTWEWPQSSETSI